MKVDILNFKSAINEIYDKINFTIEITIKQIELCCIEVVNNARNLPSPPANLREYPHQPNYIDDTSNLRKSIGYAIYFNGQLVNSNFGNQQSKQSAENVAKDFKNKGGICAVIVAGMEYAAYVESKGYDVITGSCQELPSMLKKALSNIHKIINKS